MSKPGPFLIDNLSVLAENVVYANGAAARLELQFSTVAGLLGDTAMSYTSAEAVLVTAGEYLKAGQYLYQVAAAGAANHHLTTAGGVKLYVLTDEAPLAEQFGAKGDGTTEDSSAISAALTAFGQVRLGAKTYRARNIQLTGGRTLLGRGATLKNDFGVADHLFIIDGTWTHGFVRLHTIDNGTSSGAVFDVVAGGVHHCVIEVQHLLQRAAQPIFTNINRAVAVAVYFTRFIGERWRGPQTGNRGGKMFHWEGDGNRFNANEINIMRYDCNEDYFFYFDITEGSTAFNTGNIIRPALVEIARHGFIWLGGCRNWDIQGLYHYDAPELQAHFVRIGNSTSGDATSGIRIAAATRFGGSLAAGVHDIAISGSATLISLERVGNVNTGSTQFSVDCGSREVSISAPLNGLTVANNTLGSFLGAKVVRAPRLAVRLATDAPSRSVIASGAIPCPTNGFALVDTEGNAVSDDLDTVTATDLVGGEILILRSYTSPRDVVLKHNTGNLWLKGGIDRTLGQATDIAVFIYDAGNVKWIEL